MILVNTLPTAAKKVNENSLRATPLPYITDEETKEENFGS